MADKFAGSEFERRSVAQAARRAKESAGRSGETVLVSGAISDGVPGGDSGVQ